MDIPVKYIYHGDRQRCEALYGQARRVSLILDNMMMFGGLQQQTIKFTPYPGALIVASKFFGTRVVEIHVGKVPPEEGDKKRACICNCDFTVGWIFKLQEELIDDFLQAYTVMACHRGEKYSLVKNVLASDFTLYEEFFPVIMVPYNSMLYLCCSGGGGAGSSTGCMRVDSKHEVSELEWRTSLRIIPWCGMKIPKWITPK